MNGYSHREAAEAEIPWGKNRAFQRLASEASQVAKEQEFSEQEFRWAVRQLFDAYEDFLYATNPLTVEPKDYLHWHNHYRDAHLGKKLGEPPLSPDILREAAYKYLKGPLRAPLLDRGLLDAFIAQETFAYLDNRAGRGAFMTQFGCLGVYVIFAIGYALVFDLDWDWTRFWQVIGGLFVLLLVIWAWPKKGPYALHRAMRDTYQLMTGSVVSVPELRRRIEQARGKGVVWPPELYAVLDDVEGRTKVL